MIKRSALSTSLGLYSLNNHHVNCYFLRFLGVIQQETTLPYVSFTAREFLKNQDSNLISSGKCSIVVFNNPNDNEIEETEAVILKLGLVLKQLPHFILVISNKESTTAFPTNSQLPWAFIEKEKRILSFVCPNSMLIVRKTWQQCENLRMKDMCPQERQELRIAYNNESMPYFDLKEGRADTDTLEGAVLQLFLEKNNIEPYYMYGNYEWGSIDPDTGLWNGVVGMVAIC